MCKKKPSKESLVPTPASWAQRGNARGPGGGVKRRGIGNVWETPGGLSISRKIIDTNESRTFTKATVGMGGGKEGKKRGEKIHKGKGEPNRHHKRGKEGGTWVRENGTHGNSWGVTVAQKKTSGKKKFSSGQKIRIL